MIYIGNTNPNLNFPEIKGFNSHTKLLLRGRGHLPPWPKKPGGVVQAAGPRRRSRPKRNRLRRRRWVWKVWQGLLGPFWEAGKKPCPSDIIRLVCCNELLHLLPGSTEMSTLKKKTYTLKQRSDVPEAKVMVGTIRKKQANWQSGNKMLGTDPGVFEAYSPIYLCNHICVYVHTVNL